MTKHTDSLVMRYRKSISSYQVRSSLGIGTVKPDLIAIEIFAFPSKSSVNKNDSDLTIAIP